MGSLHRVHLADSEANKDVFYTIVYITVNHSRFLNDGSAATYVDGGRVGCAGGVASAPAETVLEVVLQPFRSRVIQICKRIELSV